MNNNNRAKKKTQTRVTNNLMNLLIALFQCTFQYFFLFALALALALCNLVREQNLFFFCSSLKIGSGIGEVLMDLFVDLIQ